MVKVINEKFFDTWTEKSAYIFGYITADGCLTESKGHLRVSMSSKDKELLEQIKEALESEHGINEYKGQYSYVIHRPEIVNRLVEMGLQRRKSREGTFPEVPQEYLRHFIRGYFDGNGAFVLEKHKRDGKRFVSAFSFGSGEFGEGLSEALHSLGLRKAPVHYREKRETSFGDSYQIRFYVRDTRKLAELMYEDATIFLKRKKDKWEEHGK